MGRQGSIVAPHKCGVPKTLAATSQCGEDGGDGGEHADRLQRANAALEGLAQRWRRSAWRSASAKELAIEFVRSLQTQPDFIGLRLKSAWIEAHYRTFCRSLGLTWWPAYKDFAKELALLMPKKSARRFGTMEEGRNIHDLHGA